LKEILPLCSKKLFTFLDIFVGVYNIYKIPYVSELSHTNGAVSRE